jgi:hypothetical protein
MALAAIGRDLLWVEHRAALAAHKDRLAGSESGGKNQATC